LAKNRFSAVAKARKHPDSTDENTTSKDRARPCGRQLRSVNVY
jgi:hypothetical protein